jgi:hypothetical protein
MALMGCLGAWGTLIHEKTEVEISWHCPFNCDTVFQIFIRCCTTVRLSCLLASSYLFV